MLWVQSSALIPSWSYFGAFSSPVGPIAPFGLFGPVFSETKTAKSFLTQNETIFTNLRYSLFEEISKLYIDLLEKLMRKFLLGAILLSMTGLASAVTVEDLTSTSSWMPATDSVPSCDIPATITFKKNGKLNSEPGCNSLFGDYVIGDNDKLEFVNMGMTRKLCAKQYMDLEASFTDLLNKTKFAKKDGKYLILFDADKKEIGRLEPERSGSCS